MIEIESIWKRFGEITAVRDLSLTAKTGEVLGLLGPNGAGKSTTMRMVTGYLAPDAGLIRICGKNILSHPIAAQREIGYLPEGAPSYGDMTVKGFLKFIAEVRGLRGKAARANIDTAVEKTELSTVMEQPIETLSKGFKRRVGLAQAILHDPPVLILDEPTDGLDPNQKFAVRQLIRAMTADKTIVISTHLLEEVEAICSRMAVIDRGMLVADGAPADFLARSRYHNAVSLVLEASKAAPVRAALEKLPTITEVEEFSLPGNRLRLTGFAADGALPVEDVSAMVVGEKLPVQEFYAEPGRLDDVFRALTSSDVPVPLTPADETTAEAEA